MKPFPVVCAALLAGSAIVATSLFAQMPSAPRAHAGPPPPSAAEIAKMRADAIERTRTMFQWLDRNHDGFVSWDELPPLPGLPTAAERKAMADARFAAVDANKDGQISRAEFEAARRHPKEGWKKGEHGDGPPPPPGVEGTGPPPPGGGPMGPGLDGPMGGGRMESRMISRLFDRIDTDMDGKVSLAEAEAWTGERFDRREERRKAWTSHRGDGPGGRRGPGGPGMRGSRGGPDGMPPPPPPAN